MLFAKSFSIRSLQAKSASTTEEESKMANYGLTLVAPGTDPKVDIVFVHGLRADMEKTWTKDKVLWPAELLPKDVPDARVFLFGYDTGITHLNQGEVTKTELHSDADDLCAKLVAERSRTPEAENRPIIIIAHSLGGLVTAQLFVHGEQSSNDSSAKAIVRNIRGMIFLGTPFRGSVPAGLAECVRRILKLVGVDTQEHTLNLLGVNSEKLNELTRSFSNLLIKRRMSKDPGDQINAFFFYETLPTRIGIKYTQIVENDSAQLPGCGDSIPIRADHHDVCKFVTQKDEGYGNIIAQIQKILAPPNSDGEVGNGERTWINVYGGKAQNVGKITIHGGQTNTIN